MFSQQYKDIQTGTPLTITKGADIRDIIVDAPLTNMTIAYLQDQNAFVADKIFPRIDVPFIRGTYFTFDKHTFMSNNASTWKPGTAMNVTRLDVDHNNVYRCDYHAVGFQLPEDLQNATKPLDMTNAASEVVARNLLLDREMTFVVRYFNEDTWASKFTTKDFPAWSDGAKSNPLNDIASMQLAVFEKTGFMPQTAIIPMGVFKMLQRHPVIQKLFRHSSVPTMNQFTEDAMAQLLGLEKIYVPQAVGYLPGNDNPTPVFPKSVWVGYVAPNPGLYTNSAGYSFSYTSGTAGLDTVVRVVPDNMTLAQFVQGIQCYDMKVVNADLGAFFSGVMG